MRVPGSCWSQEGSGAQLKLRQLWRAAEKKKEMFKMAVEKVGGAVDRSRGAGRSGPWLGSPGRGPAGSRGAPGTEPRTELAPTALPAPPRPAAPASLPPLEVFVSSPWFGIYFFVLYFSWRVLFCFPFFPLNCLNRARSRARSASPGVSPGPGIAARFVPFLPPKPRAGARREGNKKFVKMK